MTKKQTAAQKRSAAAKKAAETRKANEEAKVNPNEEQNPEAEGDQTPEQVSAEEQTERDAAGEARAQQVRDSGQLTEQEAPYAHRRLDLVNAGVDQQELEDARQAELAAERDVHNERTGDASLR